MTALDWSAIAVLAFVPVTWVAAFRYDRVWPLPCGQLLALVAFVLTRFSAH